MATNNVIGVEEDQVPLVVGVPGVPPLTPEQVEAARQGRLYGDHPNPNVVNDVGYNARQAGRFVNDLLAVPRRAIALEPEVSAPDYFGGAGAGVNRGEAPPTRTLATTPTLPAAPTAPVKENELKKQVEEIGNTPAPKPGKKRKRKPKMITIIAESGQMLSFDNTPRGQKMAVGVLNTFGKRGVRAKVVTGDRVEDFEQFDKASQQAFGRDLTNAEQFNQGIGQDYFPGNKDFRFPGGGAAILQRTPTASERLRSQSEREFYQAAADAGFGSGAGTQPLDAVGANPPAGGALAEQIRVAGANKTTVPGFFGPARERDRRLNAGTPAQALSRQVRMETTGQKAERVAKVKKANKLAAELEKARAEAGLAPIEIQQAELEQRHAGNVLQAQTDRYASDLGARVDMAVAQIEADSNTQDEQYDRASAYWNSEGVQSKVLEMNTAITGGDATAAEAAFQSLVSMFREAQAENVHPKFSQRLDRYLAYLKAESERLNG